MCGIAGFVGSNRFPNYRNINSCKLSLKRRGPDASGIFKKKIKHNLLLVHTRLSIIDLKKNSSQPFSDNTGTLIFNGMIYNYLELKKHLEKKGEQFKTSSDTEVLLKMLNCYSEKAFNMMDGMWAFAYFNKKSKNMILSRDRFGEKPLYYRNDRNGFYFSNSIKALQKLSGKKLFFNEKKIKDYLTYPDKIYGLNNETFFQNIFQFPSASYLKLNLEKKNKIKFHKFWKINIKSSKKSFTNACKDIRKITKNVIKTRVRSDVLNSVLVSGGLDSNTIVSHASRISKINGYSLSSTSPQYDEIKEIKSSERLNKFKTNFVISKNSNSLSLLKKMINYGYNPLLTPTGLGLGLLCQRIKRDKNKVLLTGVGGDELFCGYYVNFLSHMLSFKKFNQFKEKYSFWKKNIKKFIRSPELKDINEAGKLKNKNRLNFFQEGQTILNNYIKNYKKIKIKKLHKDVFYNNMLQNIYMQSIPSQLFQSDYVCMYFSIENRSPFLSKDLFDYVYKLDKNFFMYKGVPKSMLRRSMGKNFPPEIMYNYEKTGFYSPFRSFFKKKDMIVIKNYLMKSQILRKNLNMNLFNKLLNNSNILHTESKFIFGCLNIAILEKVIKKKK